MACRDEPVTCRGKIASCLGLTPSKRKSWQHEGRCPACGHGGFAITAGDQGYNPLRHVWHCNCHRCSCKAADVRAAMLKAGISEDCLGGYARNSSSKKAESQADPAAVLRTNMLAVLADDEIRALADLKLRMLEVIEGKPAPADWAGFLAFAEQAGVQRSKRYDAAARWGRSATAVVPVSETLCQADAGQGPSLRPEAGQARQSPSRNGTGSNPVSGQQASPDKPGTNSGRKRSGADPARCRICHRPLDPDPAVASLGVHPMCEPVELPDPFARRHDRAAAAARGAAAARAVLEGKSP